MRTTDDAVAAARDALMDSLGAFDGATIHAGGRTVTVGRTVDDSTGEILDAETQALAPDGVSGYVTKDPLHHPFIPPDAQFEAEEEEFLPAKEIAGIAEQLIVRLPELRHIEEARVQYRWKRKGGESGGRRMFGQCVKLSQLPKHLCRVDFLIWIASDHLREARFTNLQLEALIYRELSQISYEITKQGLTKWILRGYDVQAFTKEIERYGAWHPALEQNRSAWSQLAIGAGT